MALPLPVSDAENVSSAYAKYTLGVLTAVLIVSTLDRAMLSVVADDIKRDLQIGDAGIGFLYGTAFSVFYIVFGIPMGKLADTWSRSALLTLSLVGWTVMTFCSGLSRTFGQLLVGRIGVGVGEASVGPSVFSLLSDYFPKRQRARALAVYNCGISIGTGLAAMLGGLIITSWITHGNAAHVFLGLKGWQAAMLAAGLPGVILAIVVGRLREPVRGIRDGVIEPAPRGSPWPGLLATLAAIIPGLSLVVLAREGRQAKRLLLINAVAAAIIGAVSGLFLWLTGDVAQWTILGIGAYVTFTWAQTEYRDDPVFTCIFFQSNTIRWMLVGFGLLSFCVLSFHSWWISFFMRYYAADNPGMRGTLGLLFMIFGTLGLLAGGVAGDYWRKRSSKGYLYIGAVSGLLIAPSIFGVLYAPTTNVALVLVCVAIFAYPFWLPSSLAAMQEMVLPRMRGLSSAIYLLVANLLGTAIGPYAVGKISDASGGNLRLGIFICCCGGASVGAVALLVGSRHVEREQLTLLDRARAAGEPV